MSSKLLFLPLLLAAAVQPLPYPQEIDHSRNVFVPDQPKQPSETPTLQATEPQEYNAAPPNTPHLPTPTPTETLPTVSTCFVYPDQAAPAATPRMGVIEPSQSTQSCSVTLTVVTTRTSLFEHSFPDKVNTANTPPCNGPGGLTASFGEGLPC